MRGRVEEQRHYGAQVQTHVLMDELRRAECLCANCSVRPSGNCTIANALYAVCVDNDVALAVTRCPDWVSDG